MNKKKLLDIGYAAHPLTHYNERDYDIYGVDIQKVNEHPAYYKYKELKVADLNSDPIPYEDKFFDQVYLGHTLTCLANPLRVLVEINRVLKEDGILEIKSLNPYYYVEILRNLFLNRYQAFAIQQFYSFSRWNIRLLAHRTNFKLIKEKGDNFRIPLTKKKIRLSDFPSLCDQIAYTLQKVKDIKDQLTSVSLFKGYDVKGENYEIKTTY